MKLNFINLLIGAALGCGLTLAFRPAPAHEYRAIRVPQGVLLNTQLTALNDDEANWVKGSPKWEVLNRDDQPEVIRAKIGAQPVQFGASGEVIPDNDTTRIIILWRKREK